METQLTKSDNTIKGLMANEVVKSKFAEILGKNAPAFISSVTTIATTTALQNCEPKSILSAAIAAASLNLQVHPSLGQAAIIPYNSKDGKKAQFQVMKKGFIQLGIRSGQFGTLNETEVYEGEMISYNKLTGEYDISGQKKSEIVIGFIAYFRLLNGFEKSFYMTIEDVLKHGKRYSKSFTNPDGLWQKDFQVMGKKTVLKLLISRYAPLSPDMQFAVSADQAVIQTDENMEVVSFDYPDGNGSENEQPEKLSTEQKETERIKLLIADCKDLKALKKLEPKIPDHLNDMYIAKHDELMETSLNMEG